MQKLKASEVAAYRVSVWEAQGRRCALTKKPLNLDDAVLDHCHRTGMVRGVLDRGVNTMLGKIENHMKLARLSNVADLSRMLAGVIPYMSQDHHDVMYPTHKTAEEKRVATNAKRCKARASKDKA